MARPSAVIHWIGGPVLRARSHDEFHVGEAIEVGEKRLPGEVIRLKGDAFIAQVYEDTTGLRPGDVVAGAGGPLSVRLGPTLLGHIFDGLLRPLDSGAAPEFEFSPVVERGQELRGGEIFGVVLSEGIAQKCLLPPTFRGWLRASRRPGDMEAMRSSATCGRSRMRSSSRDSSSRGRSASPAR
jgi:V/A-type H+/Na+-transporting ATPase subunit A